MLFRSGLSDDGTALVRRAEVVLADATAERSAAGEAARVGSTVARSSEEPESSSSSPQPTSAMVEAPATVRALPRRAVRRLAAAWPLLQALAEERGNAAAWRRTTLPIMQDNLRRFAAAGGTLALGDDYGCVPWPAMPGGKKSVVVGAYGSCVSAKSANADDSGSLPSPSCLPHPLRLQRM